MIDSSMPPTSDLRLYTQLRGGIVRSTIRFVIKLVRLASVLTVFAVVLATMARKMSTLIDNYIGSIIELADNTMKSTGRMASGAAS